MKTHRYSLTLTWLDEDSNQQSKYGWWCSLDSCKEAARVLQNNNPNDVVEIVDHENGQWVNIDF